VIDAYSYSYPLRKTIVAENSIAHYLDIPKSAFPPINKLDDSQIREILKEMKQVLHMLRLHVHFPTDFPPCRQYELLIDMWDQPIQLKGHKKQYLDFCNMEPHQCPYGDNFCYCRQAPEDWESL